MKRTKGIKDRLLREEENYYNPVRVSNFWSDNYIKYKSNDDRNKEILVGEYLNKIRPYLKNIKNNFKKFGTWQIQLIVASNFISSIDNDKELVMHS